MPTRRFIAFVIGVCLAGGLQAQTEQEPPIESHVIDNDSMSPWTYWTKERMDKAAPAPLPSDDMTDDTAGTLAAGAPTADSCPTGLLFLTDLSRQPYASAGRLFFNDGSTDLYCTAQFTETGRTLLTAAHCVRNMGGEWYTRFFFVQGYDAGKGNGVVLSLVATWRKYWYPRVDRAFDYAFFRTSSFSNAKWLQLGAPDSHPFWLAIGYPENSKYNGRKRVQIMGPKEMPDLPKGIVQMLGNPMERGASGGAWIANPGMCSAAGNVVVGLTASRSNKNCELNSPVLNKETALLLRYVRHPSR